MRIRQGLARSVPQSVSNVCGGQGMGKHSHLCEIFATLELEYACRFLTLRQQNFGKINIETLRALFEVTDTNDETYFKISVCQLISDLKRGYPKLEIHHEENLLAL